MNILIVDDNANNRMILKLLLEDYEEENKNISFTIDEACDGLEAVKKCEEKKIDLVLMDIMMPNMDGIEATKQIRNANRDIMIIAVSAVDDSVRQRKILNNGAEDYISKPVNADIFASRISNYITLVEARKFKEGRHSYSYATPINLFNKNTYSRYTTFVINSEDTLSEFWEFFLLNVRLKYDNLSDVVRTIVSIAEAQLKLSVEGNVYIEQSDDFQYFTLENLDKLPAKVVELILKKNSPEAPYKINDEKISFELARVYTFDDDEENNYVVESDIPVATKPVQDAEPVDLESHKSKELQVFDYLYKDDLLDLEEYASKLNSLMLIVGSGDVTHEELEEMYTYLDKIGSVISTYSEVYPISKALTQLSQDLASHEQEFIENSEALGPMCKAFSNDMSKWIQMSFHTGAPSADFMNDTIVVNCETISSMLKMNDDTGSDDSFDELDDIFDF